MADHGMMHSMSDHDRESALGLMPRPPSREEVTEALEECWTGLLALGAELDDDQWIAETAVPGWRVRDIFAHIIGAERMLAGEPQPEVDLGSPAHVRNEIGMTNEAWVRSLADRSPAELLDDLRSVAATRIDTLKAMTDDEWNAESWTPAGDATRGRWLHIRVYDCWVHEQDIRVAVAMPGGLTTKAAELSLLEVTNALGFIVGKKAEAEDGSRVEIRLTHTEAGDTETQVIRVEVANGRATLVAELSGPPTAVVAVPFELFMRLTAGRRSASNALNDGLIQLDGDIRSGERLARNLAFTV